MKHRNPTLLFLLLASLSVLFLLNFPSNRSVTSQTRERRVGGNSNSASTDEEAGGERLPPTALPAPGRPRYHVSASRSLQLRALRRKRLRARRFPVQRGRQRTACSPA